jgi:hypothetical protein
LSFSRTTSFFWCIMCWIFSLSFKISFSCTYTSPCRPSLFRCKAINWISRSYAYFFKAQHLASFFFWFSFNKIFSSLIISYNCSYCSKFPFLWFAIIISICNLFNFHSLAESVFLVWSLVLWIWHYRSITFCCTFVALPSNSYFSIPFLSRNSLGWKHTRVAKF